MAFSILVVDDEPDLKHLIRAKLRRQIDKGLYQFDFAENGVQALEKLRESNDIDMVLSDIRMPEMDGLTLLADLRRLYPLLKAVVVSAYGDMDNIRTAMNRGAFDFLTKPINFQDLDVTIQKTMQEIEFVKGALASRDKLIAIQQELKYSTKLQQSILPKNFTEFGEANDLQIYAEMSPAKEIGGDFYDFFNVGDGTIGLVIGDVSGKGMAAALFMAVTRTLMHAVALFGYTPNVCLRKVNRLLCENNAKSMFVTLFYGYLNVRDGKLVYANGGHNFPLLIRNHEVEPLSGGRGMGLGVDEDAEFDSGRLKLKPGDLLFLYTDGITEALDELGNEFSTHRLINVLEAARGKSPQELIACVLNGVDEFSAGEPQSDDITMLAVEYGFAKTRILPKPKFRRANA